ncbi:type 1 fimbrial major subunit FimA (plasmid) [Enterobacter sp. D2]|uniref:type 1 fimbrial major subunit FimA n=1 Tax=Enterobacter sp. D2 TaxID=3102784 RepID=UPI002ACA9C1D|nr:type 1 fimbrial major subunit FimA [Enterobacter sp. D2]MDZ5731094.1 type 1 fimbrial major subunit FimA [Enterobacter sp. D2]
MKYTLISSALLTTLLLSGNASATFGGTVRFEGQVVTGACAVNANSVDQTVKMGQVRTASLANVGDMSGRQPFFIQLDDCDTAVAATAAVGFTGAADGADPLALAINGGAGAATGVGIYISDSTSSIAPLDGTLSTAVNLFDGTNRLPFHANYVATQTPVTAGIANAVATFNVIYQ